jgi:GT2 family glycosyltransferase
MQQTNDHPSVLAVLVARNGAPWLRRVLSSLARQTHPRVGVLAVDNASSDGSADVLERMLGRRRVLRLDRDLGFPGAVRRALELPAAGEADFVLLLHDDVALEPHAVERMVEAARRVEGIGLVGPKVLDWDRPRVLREIGFSADRFGYPQSPLEEGELDQGQYDAPREVLFVSSAAMLLSRAAWSRAGLPDERLAPDDGDLDYGWRVRLAGFRVMVAPGAVAHHRGAAAAGVRAGAAPLRGRYRAERAALAALLTNCGLVTLLWVLPLYAIQGIGRLLLYLMSRRFDQAGEVMAAWGWNLAHFPGTLQRRVRAQSVRRVPDREVSRFLSPARARLTGSAQQASALLLGRRTARVEEGEELEAPPLPRRVASVVSAHPVAVASIAAVILTLVAFRGVLFVPRIEGGALPAFPHGPGDFFRAMAAPWRSTGFGGPEAPSPAMIPLGVASFLTLGDPDLLARLLVALTPVAAGVVCHLALRRLGATPGPSVVGGVSYALSALVLWAASEGRISVSVLLVTLPWLVARLPMAFAREGPHRPLRWVVGTGMALALVLSFFPAVRLSLGLVLVALLLLPEPGGSRVRGALLTVSAGAVAAALVFPLVVVLSASGGGAAESAVHTDVLSLLRLSPGDAPGAGPGASFLPLAGVVGFVLAGGGIRRTAWRSFLVAAAGLPLAWLAAAHRLPEPVSNPVAFLSVAAVSLAFLAGLGAGSLGPTVLRAAFGLPQVLGAALVTVIVVGWAAQAFQTAVGAWAVGEDRLPPAWPVVASAEPGASFRVLWLGADDGRRFPPPGGDPEGRVATEEGVAVAYGVTGRRGTTIAGTALPSDGPPYRRLEIVLAEILSSRIRHGGSLLAPFGIRYVVAGEGRLPSPVVGALGDQLDIDLVQRAGGLSVYRNARLPVKAATFAGGEALDAARTPSLLAPLSLDAASAEPLARRDGATWSGSVSETPSLVVVGDRFDPRWRAGQATPFPAFGWALGFEADQGEVRAALERDVRRPVELIALTALWAVALWFVRREGREEAAGHRSGSSPPVPTAMPAGKAGP